MTLAFAGRNRKTNLHRAATFIGRSVTVEIDRPLGSRHPDFPDLVYPVNYGFLPGTKAPDGREIDAYVLGLEVPIETFKGRCIAVVYRLDDVEDKLVFAPFGLDFIADEIRAATAFQEQFFQTRLIFGPAEV